jgi:hypothetical protein
MMTAPIVARPLFRLLQTRGIEMNVANQFEKVSVPVAENRFVSSLKEMANSAIPSDIVLGVGKLNSLENLG